MKTDQIINEMLAPNSPLGVWFISTAETHADKRAGVGTGQDFAIRAMDKAIDALQRHPERDIKHPKTWLSDLIDKAWKNETTVYVYEQERYETHDVYEDRRSPYALTKDDKAAIATAEAERKAERKREWDEWNARELRPRDAAPPPPTSLKEQELERRRRGL